ncbi:hypothetical protein H4S08_002439 [Coemansia sp. RSA 1365]|nr:hypothetical protein H4S08_002439 [Coemansia sp. RSA 1365]
MADIRVSKPYYRLKRGTLTVFVETKSTEKIFTIKTKLLSALHAQDKDGLFSNLNIDSIQLIALQDQQQLQQLQPAHDSRGQLRLLDDNDKINAGDLIDDGVIYFVFKQEDGTYEEPSVVDYDADTHDMGAACY